MNSSENNEIFKKISFQRAEDIILSANPKFKWFYQIIKDDLQKVIFYCENFYKKYVLEFPYTEQSIFLISHLVSLMKERGFQRIE